MLLRLPTLFLMTKNKNYFVFQCYLDSHPPKLHHSWFRHRDVIRNDVEADFLIKTTLKWDGGCRQYALTKKMCICIVLYRMILH